MQVSSDGTHDRIKSGAAVAVVHALLAYAFIAGLRFERGSGIVDSLAVFDLAEPSPRPPVEEPVPAPVESDAPEGAASPPNLKALASPVKAPPPHKLRVETPPTITAAPTPAQGTDNSAGASDVAGPGTGAGGAGEGTGSGSAGAGDGSGGSATRARKISGRIEHSDYPRDAGDAGAEGTVVVHFDVGAEGHVTGCKVADSSGNAELDAVTCRLVEQRFRYEPAKDAQGRAVPAFIEWTQIWWIGPRRHRPID